MNGTIANRSSEVVWVLETDSGPAIAHKLAPGRRSPSSVDADGVKTVSGKKITSHPSDLGTSSWWKVTDVETATLTDGPSPHLFIVIDAGVVVGDGEFGPVQLDPSAGWGEPL